MRFWAWQAPPPPSPYADTESRKTSGEYASKYIMQTYISQASQPFFITFNVKVMGLEQGG